MKAQCDEHRAQTAKSGAELKKFIEGHEKELMDCLELNSINFFMFKRYVSSYGSPDNEEVLLVLDTVFREFNIRILQNRMYPYLKMNAQDLMTLMSLPLSTTENNLRVTLSEIRFSKEEKNALVSFWSTHWSSFQSMEELYDAHILYTERQIELDERKRKDAFVEAWGLESSEDIRLLNNIPYFEKLEQAKACAAQLDRPLLICFSGHTVLNAKKMEENVLADPAVQEVLSTKFILVLLMVDDQNPLPKGKQRTEDFQGQSYELKTRGDQWALLELTMLNDTQQPVFVKTNAELVQIGDVMKYTSSIAEFRTWLKEE